MASFGTTVRAALQLKPTVVALVATRIYPIGEVPQNPVLPYVCYQRVTGYRVRSVRGPSGLARSRVQIDCYAASYESAQALGEAVKKVDGYSGRPSAAVGDVQGVQYITERDDVETTTAGGKLHRHSADYYIWHEEEV